MKRDRDGVGLSREKPRLRAHVRHAISARQHSSMEVEHVVVKY
jgi:hypothetical protein